MNRENIMINLQREISRKASKVFNIQFQHFKNELCFKPLTFGNSNICAAQKYTLRRRKFPVQKAYNKSLTLAKTTGL